MSARNHENLHRGGRRQRRPTIEERVTILERQMRTIMAQIDDLNAIIDKLTTDVGNTVSELRSELQTAQAAAAANQPVDLSGAIAKLDTLDTTVAGAQSATTAASSPTPPAGAATTTTPSA